VFEREERESKVHAGRQQGGKLEEKAKRGGERKK